jgi:hypothetical protein
VAAIHGYTVTLAWGGGIELVGALLAFVLINAPRPRSATGLSTRS